MLSQLTIKNFGLIDQLSIDYAQGLNVLTGSTGAGKSIIIDGLRFVLGERLKTSQIRNPEKPCLIEAVFEIQDKKLQDHEVFCDFFSDGDPSFIINRQYLPDGRTRVKINGSTVTVAQLKEVGNHLIDFHGPHDHQMLLSDDFHLGMLDQLVDFGKQKDVYAEKYAVYKKLQDQLKDLQSMAGSRQRDLELLSHQVKELEQVLLSQDAYDELCQQQVKINNVEKLFEQASLLLQIFEGQETGLSDLIQRGFSPIRHLSEIDEDAGRFEKVLLNIQENSDQLVVELRDYLDSLSFDPQEANEVSQRYDIYEDIKRKYGPTIEDAQSFYEQAQKKYEILVDFEHNDAELKSKVTEAQKELKKNAQRLTQTRKKTASLLQKTIEKELKDLGIEHVAFEARFFSVDFNPDGQDKVVFYISPNAGEDLKPLAEIVSSGEAARLMLALKKALTKVDPIPVLIFDEIDAQIGGRLGTIIGNKLKELSHDRQVLLITHLPQIASFADIHFKVIKEVVDGRTISRVEALDQETRVEELAQMMSGEDQTDVSVKHAEDMLASAQKK